MVVVGDTIYDHDDDQHPLSLAVGHDQLHIRVEHFTLPLNTHHILNLLISTLKIFHVMQIHYQNIC